MTKPPVPVITKTHPREPYKEGDKITTPEIFGGERTLTEAGAAIANAAFQAGQSGIEELRVAAKDYVTAVQVLRADEKGGSTDEVIQSRRRKAEAFDRLAAALEKGEKNDL